MKRTTFGLDLAKRVFQVHAVDAATGEISRETLKRSRVLEYFGNREPCVVAMEGCGSAQYWARELVKLGHEVKLIAAQFVRPFVKTNKTDVADAEAIWEAAQRPGMRYVALKSEEQQAVLGLHRRRAQRVRVRSALVNQLHGRPMSWWSRSPTRWRGRSGRCSPMVERIKGAMVGRWCLPQHRNDFQRRGVDRQRLRG